MRKYLFILIALLSLVSCNIGKEADSAIDAENVEMKYAQLLTMHKGDGFVTAEILNPWDSTKILHRYVLVPQDELMPSNLPEGDVIRTPISHAVVFTSVHASLISQLDAYQTIAGVCDKEYLYLDKLKDDVSKAKVVDCGNSMTPDIEKIIDLSPDAILLSPFENSGTYGKTGQIGIPIIECADYMETSPLGRAEWVRFYGMLVGRQQQADSLFAATEQAYNELKAKVSEKFASADSAKTKKPTVITEKKYNSSWFVAGANSTVGQMLSDAGADYVFSDEKSSGSVPYDPEVVFDRGQQADVWLIKYNSAVGMSYKELSQEWANYSRMEAFRKHNVYGCNLADGLFYEETPFRPDLLLRDYVIMFHPDVLSGDLRYYKKLDK